MNERELHARILGIEAPWKVQRVELAVERGQIHIYLAHDDQVRWPCPVCGKEASLYDHQPERQWRHLDTCQYETILHASPPRSDCEEHGPRVVRLPWAEPESRFTTLMEAVVIHWLEAASQKAVAQQLGLSWDEVHGIQRRAVARGLARREQEPLRYLGVDEKAFRKGHRYLTLVNDLDRGRVLSVTAERKRASLDAFWEELPAGQKAGVEAVAMDMWEPYVASTREQAPRAAIVHDKFHIAKHLGEAVDKVRRQEQRQLSRQGDERLKGTKYDWLRHPAHFAAEAWRAFDQLRRSKLKTARAWAMKESLMEMFDCRQLAQAQEIFGRWYNWSVRSRLEPMAKVARMLKKHAGEILTYFRHRITNATSESINSKIQWVKYTARGFRNYDNFVTAVYFHCGGLDLAP